MLQYRVKVGFDNGETHYSNLVALKNEAGNNQPKLISTILTGNNIYVSSPGIFDYALYDLNGKVLLRGQLSTGMNSLPTCNLNSGMYMIRFSKGAAQWTEKLIRQ
jgi:hypothetical protein